jgi:hypothetical protein
MPILRAGRHPGHLSGRGGPDEPGLAPAPDPQSAPGHAGRRHRRRCRGAAARRGVRRLLMDDAEAPDGVLDKLDDADELPRITDQCERLAPKDRSAPMRCLLAKVASLTQYPKWHVKCQPGQVAKLRCIHDAQGIPVVFALAPPAAGERAGAVSQSRPAPPGLSPALAALDQVAGRAWPVRQGAQEDRRGVQAVRRPRGLPALADLHRSEDQ